MQKDLRYGLLLDFYGPLMTGRQREALYMYYDGDLSLAEISEETGVTRQAALDAIKRGTEKLERLERELKVCERYELTAQAVLSLEKALERLGDGKLKEEMAREIARIKSIWEA